MVVAAALGRHNTNKWSSRRRYCWCCSIFFAIITVLVTTLLQQQHGVAAAWSSSSNSNSYYWSTSFTTTCSSRTKSFALLKQQQQQQQSQYYYSSYYNHGGGPTSPTTSLSFSSSSRDVFSFYNQKSSSRSRSRSSRSSSVMTMMAAIPVLEKWTINRLGEVTGTIYNHPTLDDGDVITTSRLRLDKKINTKSSSLLETIEEGQVVTTESGSKYKLGESKRRKKKKKAPATSPAPATTAAAPRPPPAKAPARPSPSQPPSQQPKKLKMKLNGMTVGNGKYALAGNSQRSTSGKSQIWNCYRLKKNPNTGEPLLTDLTELGGAELLTIKISPNVEAVTRENKNYLKISQNWFGPKGQFVNRIDFLPQIQPGTISGGGKTNNRKITIGPDQCALVMESGAMDLKMLLTKRKNKGLEGRAMRDAAAAAAQCLEAVHGAGMVWTDLKAENFVVIDNNNNKSNNNNNEKEQQPPPLLVKGIDLESAMPQRDNPVDYSPEACPPEFATQYVTGMGAYFVLEPSYDIWSLGMMLLELSTGRGYWDGKTPLQITKALRFPLDTSALLAKVKDPNLRNLIESCLQEDPKKRPSITQVLLHPYFLTTGIGPVSFIK